MNRETDISNNIITDLSNNINESNDTITNILQNIYQEAVARSNRNITAEDRYLHNNLDRLRFLFGFDNSLNNVFNEINPMLMNSNNDNPFTINLDEVFSNLINNTINTQSNLNGILNNSFDNDKSIYKKVLSDKGKTQLKKCLFKDSSKTNNSCPIFHQEFTEEDEIIELPCKHCFVPEAIEKWLNEEQAACPVCRFELDSKEIKIKKIVTNNENNEIDSDDEDVDSDDEDGYEQVMQTAILESLRN